MKKPLSDDDGLFVARRAPPASACPRPCALVGATVKVYDAEREVCVARVKDLGLEAEAIHFPDRWDDPDATTAKRVDHDATAVFDLGMPMLLGSLEPVIGTAADCAKGVWAAPVEAARPRLFRAVAMDKKLSKPAVRAYRKLAAWQERQAAFATFYSDVAPEKGRWDATAQHEITRFVADDGSREVLVVTANTNDGCGSSGQQLTALFDVVRDGKDVSLAPITARAWEGAPSGIVDLDADGQLELESDGTIFRWHGDRPAGNEQNGWVDRQYEQLERAVVPDLTIEGCGC
ncbi:MAG: hypothetical protein U1F43_27745 [Myxococcota bacterium]